MNALNQYEVYVHWPGQGNGSSTYFWSFKEAWDYVAYLLSPVMGYGLGNTAVVLRALRTDAYVETRPLVTKYVASNGEEFDLNGESR